MGLNEEYLKKWERIDKSKLSDDFINEFVTNIEFARHGDYNLDKSVRELIKQEALEVVKQMIEETLKWN